MRREAGKKEQEPVLLTLSNAVDQTQKIKVEVSPSTTIKQASIDAGVAPKGAFDVFTAGGKAVTKSKASNHRNEVLYVGPQKVAGGSDWSFFDDDGFEFGARKVDAFKFCNFRQTQCVSGRAAKEGDFVF